MLENAHAGSKVGNLIIHSHSVSHFVKLCVEMDLGKPLAGHIEIDGHSYNVEYEGLNAI